MSSSGKPHISIVTSGHVDSGKSTSVGRFIFDLGGISQRDMDKLKDEAAKLGKSSFCFAFYMDRQKDERERGITISCTTKEFFTENYHYTIIDAPGHRDFIKNMISGASQADVGLLLVPADGGFVTSIARGNREEGQVQGQTRQHARLLNLLGVKQLIIGINKMDSDVAMYGEARYKEIVDEVKDMLIKVGWTKDFVNNSVPFIPYSAWKGDNMVNKSENMKWWNGVDVKAMDGSMVHVSTLLECFNNYVKLPKRKTDSNLRIPISGVYKIKGIGDVLTGRVEQGVVKPGDEVVFLPTHTPSNPCSGKIFTVEMHHKSVPEGHTGDNIGMSIKGLPKDHMPQIGDIMVLKNDTSLKSVTKFTLQVQVLDHPGELKVGYTPICFVRTNRAACKIVEFKWKMGKETGGKKLDNPQFIKQGEAGEIVFEAMQPFVVEPYDKCEGLGRVAIMDGNSVVMIGKVVSVE